MHQKLFFSFMICAMVLWSPKLWANSVDNTELQWLLCEPSVDSFRAKTNSPIGAGSSREVYYAETKKLGLLSLSAVARIRVTNKKIKSTVKLNYPTDQNLPWDSLAGKDSKCEWDRHDQHFKVGCSLNAKREHLADFLSPDQKDYLTKERGFTNFSELLILGPAKSTEWSWLSDFMAETGMSLEIVQGPEQKTWMELSARVPLKDAETAYREIQGWLELNQVLLCPSQTGISESLIRAFLKQLPP